MNSHSHPGHIAKVIARYPELKVIIGHAGYPKWWEAAIAVAKGHPNCYVELSNWNFGAVDMSDFVPILAYMRDTPGADHMMLGSDQLTGKRYCGEKSFLPLWVDFFKRLPETAKTYGYEFTKEEVDLILGGTAQKLLKL